MSERKSPDDYPPGKYFIRRHNAWFRPGAHGYTVHLAAAGLFDREKAVKYLDVEDLTIHHAKDFIEAIETQINFHFAAIVRLEQHLHDIRAA